MPHAAPEYWLLGDWLAARVPVGVRGRTTGTRCTFGGLAARAGVSHNHLRLIRGTAHHWPPETRVPAAPFHVHGALRDGGRERAGRRRDRLFEMERYTATSLRRWREAHAEYVPREEHVRRRSGRPSSRRGTTPLPARVTARSAPAPRRGAEGGPRCYLSALRAADVHAFVRSRRKFAWAVAMLETHSMSLDPGPRSRESETALRVDS